MTRQAMKFNFILFPNLTSLTPELHSSSPIAMGKSRDEYNRRRRERLEKFKNPETAAEAEREKQRRKRRLDDLEHRMSGLLRCARGQQVELDDSGWAKMSDVTAYLGATHNEVLSAVRRNFFQSKGRFQYSVRGGTPMVRAVQGHFVDLPGLWADYKRDSGQYAVHGTKLHLRRSIGDAGLMGRDRMVHMTRATVEDVQEMGRKPRGKSWMYVLVRMAGLDIRRARNGVLLSRDTIPPDHLRFFDHEFREINGTEDMWAVINTGSW